MSMKSIFNLGNLGNGPTSSLTHQLDMVKQKIESTSKLAADYNKKYATLNEFNKLLTDSYIENLNALIEVSDVLTQYQSVMDIVIENLQQFDTSISSQFRDINVEHIKDLTSRKLDKVNDFFNGEKFLSLKSLLDKHRRPEVAAALNKVDANLKNLKQTSSSVHKQLQDGGRRRRKITRSK